MSTPATEHAMRTSRRSSLPQTLQAPPMVSPDSPKDCPSHFVSQKQEGDSSGRRLSAVFGSEFTSLPSRYHEDAPDQRKRASSATRVRDLPPPLPLHDFTKDRPQTQLPKTGFRYILPAPRHYYAACAKNEPMESADHVVSPAFVNDLRQQQAERRSTHPGQVVFSADKPLEGSNEYATPEGVENTLVFESRFESGNLRQATQVGPYEYDLELRYDINTNGHAQWFYFSVKNTRKDCEYKFNLVNFSKKDSLYGRGLRPLMFSERRAKAQMQGWRRCGKDICYFEAAEWPSLQGRGSYTLHFSTQFQYDDDTVYLAHCYPYAYRDLQEYLDHLEMDPARRKHVRRRVLCETIAKNNLDLVTITAPAASQEEARARPVVCISARVHPGETNASWMMKGVLDFLTSEDATAHALRQRVEFRLVPMLNPDGVVNGNYRCNLSGHDLNRRWKTPHREIHPTIFHYKQMLASLTPLTERGAEDRTVLMTIDLHGHSRAKNVFIYGCHAKFWKDSCGPAPPPLREQVFPWLLAARSHPFSFRHCKFKVRRCKESSGRVVCWRQMGVTNSYTLEASFGGPDQGTHLSTYDLEAVGRAMCESIAEYLEMLKDSSAMEHVVSEIAAGRDTASEDATGSESAGEVDSSSDDEVIQTSRHSTAKPSKPKGRAKRKGRKDRTALSEEGGDDDGPSTFPGRNKLSNRRLSAADATKAVPTSSADGGVKRLTQQTLDRLSQPRRVPSSRRLSVASAEWRMTRNRDDDDEEEEEESGSRGGTAAAGLGGVKSGGDESRHAWLARVYASMTARDSDDDDDEEDESQKDEDWRGSVGGRAAGNGRGMVRRYSRA